MGTLLEENVLEVQKVDRLLKINDDLLICVQGKEIHKAFHLAQDVLDFIYEWFHFDRLLPLSVLPHPSVRQPVQILGSMDIDENSFSNVCYKDGNKIDDEVGFAYVIFKDGVEIECHQFRIRN
ncbi:hypothetical protein X975_23174, partial [Stegodyphus mimosarum]